MNAQEELITSLSRDLAPVRPAPNVTALAMLWFLVSAGFVVIMTYLVGPIRPGALYQLVTEPRFLIETLLGVAAVVWVATVAFRAAVPAALSRTFAAVGLVLMSLWLAQYVIGLADPALEPSALGKRGHCYLETMAYSLPAILVALLLIRRLYPLRFGLTAMAVSLAAGMLPALYMQLACMYVPSHILLAHVAPAALLGLLGAVAGPLVLRRI